MPPASSLRRTVVITAIASMLLLPGVATASSIDEVVNLISKNVLKYVEDQGKKELFIDQFKGPKTSGGRLLETRIRQKLKDDGVTILSDDLEASWTLTGRLSTDTSGKTAIVAVRVELLDGGGNSKAEFKKRFRQDPDVQQELKDSLPPGTDTATVDVDAVLDGADDVATVASTTVDNLSAAEKVTGTDLTAESSVSSVASTSSSGAILNKAQQVKQAADVRSIPAKLQKNAIDSPSFFADGTTRIRASATSGFALEIRTSNSETGPFIPIAVQDRGGRAFVDIQQEQFFQIHVSNTTDFDVGLELKMDGINSMHFAEGVNVTPEFQNNGKWLITRGIQGAAIKGWFINSSRVDRFIIKAEPDGVAANVATLGRPHPIGTIQATFFRAVTPGQGLSQFAKFFDTTRNAVGRGAPTRFGGRMEERRFELGQSLASIAILYRNPSPPDLPPPDTTP